MARKSKRPMLRRGSKGVAVRELQELLGIEVDGDFGYETEAAVIQLQRDYDDQGNYDGVVGPRTWQALRKRDVPPAAVTSYTDPTPYGWRTSTAEPDPYGWQTNIVASVFGGSEDYRERSAYDNHLLDDTSFYVSLPHRFRGPRRKVEVTNRNNGKSVICTIEDVGPWLTDDPYWIPHSRPLAELSHNGRTPLTRGPNKGRVANGAGIDLSPAAAHAIGIDGLGVVNFRFV